MARPASPVAVGDAAGPEPTSIRDVAHYPSLDGLRAFAVTAVLLFHVGECWQQALDGSGFGRLLYRLTDMGYVGVDLFFVLSGFLITRILVETRGQARYFRSFYVRRSLRIFPLYYAYLAVMTLIAVLLPQWPGAGGFLGDFPWYAFYATNFEIAQRGYPAFTPVHHLWSLAVEEQFYLLWPTVVAWIAPRRLFGWTALMVLAVWIGRAWWIHRGASPLAVYVDTPTRLDALLMGSCLGLASADGAWGRLADRWAPRLVAVGAVVVLLLLARVHGLSAGEPHIQTFGFAAFAVLFTGIVGSCVGGQHRGRGPRLLQAAAPRRIGRLGYGIYLFHWPIVLGVSALIHRWVQAALPGFALSLALALLASYGLAEVSYRLLEAPLLALRQRYPRPSDVAATALPP